MNKKILIIEDEVYLVELYKEILSDAGYQVFYAYNGEEGLAIVEKEKPDLILLDLMLPTGTINGSNVLQTVKSDPGKYGTPYVLVLTNLTSDIVIKDMFEQKADGFLMKTELTPAQILKEVKNYLER
jgi:DNA-binding response OmpR family regulator